MMGVAAHLPVGDDPVSFECTPVTSAILATGVVWEKVNCSSTGSGVPFFGPLGPLIVNMVHVDLSTPGIRLVPVRSAPPSFLQPLNEMVKSDGRPGLLAGINAGYFWRLDVSTFFDSVCLFKSRADAQHNGSVGGDVLCVR